MYPGQTSVQVQVYQGESEIAGKNHFLGNFLLEGIPENGRERERLDIAFTYNVNGMLQVEATVASTGKKADLTINLMDKQLENLLYRLKKTILEENEFLAGMIADDLEDILMG